MLQDSGGIPYRALWGSPAMRVFMCRSCDMYKKINKNVVYYKSKTNKKKISKKSIVSAKFKRRRSIFVLWTFTLCISFVSTFRCSGLLCSWVVSRLYNMKWRRRQRYITTCKEFTIVRQVGIHLCLRVAMSMVLITVTRNLMSIQRMFSHN